MSRRVSRSVARRRAGPRLVAALCLATDLGMRFPFEHGLHSTLIAMRLADGLGVDRETRWQTYYACLLAHSGCTTDAHVTPEVYGDSLTTHLNPVMYGSGREVLTGLMRALPDPESAGPVRAFQVARRFPRMVRETRTHLTAACEVAAMLADRLGLSRSVGGLLAYMLERWDGHGPPRACEGRGDAAQALPAARRHRGRIERQLRPSACVEGRGRAERQLLALRRRGGLSRSLLAGNRSPRGTAQDRLSGVDHRICG